MVLEFDGFTVLRLYSSGSMFLAFNGSMVQRFYGSTVLLCYRVFEFYGSTVLGFLSCTVEWFCGAMVL